MPLPLPSSWLARRFWNLLTGLALQGSSVGGVSSGVRGVKPSGVLLEGLPEGIAGVAEKVVLSAGMLAGVLAGNLKEE